VPPATDDNDNSGHDAPRPDNDGKNAPAKPTAPREERKAAPVPKPNTPTLKPNAPRDERKTTPRP